jgi:hypothetical protein
MDVVSEERDVSTPEVAQVADHPARRRARVVPLVALALSVFAGLSESAGAESKSDRAILKAGVIAKADVPPAWTSKKPAKSDWNFKRASECTDIKSAIDNAEDKLPRRDSRDFADPSTRGATSAGGTVYAFRDSTAAAKFVANFRNNLAAGCLRKSLARSTSEIDTGGFADISPIAAPEGVADEVVGYEETISGAVENPDTGYVDFVAVRVGRAVIDFGFTSLAKPIPERAAIVDSVARRVAAAQ